MECGGKRSATPLLPGRYYRLGKAPSPQGSASALHSTAGDVIRHVSLTVKCDEKSGFSTKRISMEVSDKLFHQLMAEGREVKLDKLGQVHFVWRRMDKVNHNFHRESMTLIATLASKTINAPASVGACAEGAGRE